MSHVDEGTLHAYLDGELLPPEHASLEAHLAECTACRSMLADERALRERASAVLGAARPRERPAPPLEQLRTPKRSPWYVRRSFAWAASIALALGIGYELRSSPTASPIAQTRQVVDDAAPQASTPTAESRAARDGFGAPPPAAQRRRAAAKTAAPTDAPAARVPVTTTGDSSRQPAALAGRIERDSVARQGLQANRFRLDEVVVTGQGRASAVARGERRTAGWPTITRAVAQTALGTDPVGIPGLPTRAIRRDPTGGSIVVEQALDSTNVIQFFQTPAAASLSGEESAPSPAAPPARVRAPERADRLARFIGRLRVEIAGPVSVDSLNRLLEQAKPLP